MFKDIWSGLTGGGDDKEEFDERDKELLEETDQLGSALAGDNKESKEGKVQEEKIDKANMPI